MKVLIDTNVLIRLLGPAKPSDVQARLDGLLQEIQAKRGQLLIPAQAIAELLVLAPESQKHLLTRLANERYVRIVAYDERAAVETAAMHRAALAAKNGHKRWPLKRDTAWQKVKVDVQVVALAKIHGASIVAEDRDVHQLAAAALVKCVAVKDLPIPDSARQLRIDVLDEVPPQAVPVVAPVVANGPATPP